MAQNALLYLVRDLVVVRPRSYLGWFRSTTGQTVWENIRGPFCSTIKDIRKKDIRSFLSVEASLESCEDCKHRLHNLLGGDCDNLIKESGNA